VCGAQGGICRVNSFFFNPVACCFLYKAKDLSAPLISPIVGADSDPGSLHRVNVDRADEVFELQTDSIFRYVGGCM
jgi:hypothetical protein